MTEVSAINLTEQYKKIKSKHSIVALSIIIFIAIIDGIYFRKGNTLFYIGYGLMNCASYIPIYILLNLIKCPQCNKKYFKSKIQSHREFKKFLDSNNKCINCNISANFILK